MLSWLASVHFSVNMALGCKLTAIWSPKEPILGVRVAPARQQLLVPRAWVGVGGGVNPSPGTGGLGFGGLEGLELGNSGSTRPEARGLGRFSISIGVYRL